MNIQAINGKTYNIVGEHKIYGDILEANGKYFYFSKRAFRMIRVSKNILAEAI